MKRIFGGGQISERLLSGSPVNNITFKEVRYE